MPGATEGYRVRSTPGPTTIADLERLPDDDYKYDLVRGWLVREPPAGGRHGEINSELIIALGNHLRRTGQGRVFSPETGFVLVEDPPTVRGPDVAYVAESRLPAGQAPAGFLRLAPDLAVEVVSPSNRWTDIAAKVRDYLDAGTRLVWIVDPPRRTVTVHRRDGSADVRGEDDALDGEDVLPGFQLMVRSLFRD